MKNSVVLNTWKIELKNGNIHAASDYHLTDTENWDEKYMFPYKNGYNHIIHRYRNLDKIFPGKKLDIFTIGSNHPNNTKEFLYHDVAEGIVIYMEDKLILKKGSSGLSGISLEEIIEKYIEKIKKEW